MISTRSPRVLATNRGKVVNQKDANLCKERNAQSSRGSQKVLISNPRASKGFVQSFEVAVVQYISVNCIIVPCGRCSPNSNKELF